MTPIREHLRVGALCRCAQLLPRSEGEVLMGHPWGLCHHERPIDELVSQAVVRQGVEASPGERLTGHESLVPPSLLASPVPAAGIARRRTVVKG